jgi:chemotaxis protein methyltransferase CheR
VSVDREHPPLFQGIEAPPDDIRDIEITLLLEAMFLRYGYDFREYARETLDRRIAQFLTDTGIPSIGEVITRILRDPSTFYRLVGYFSVNVTALFRDPFVYAALRDHVLPMLRTWPHVKIWDAGCATGEELYSLAVLLTEAGLYDRCTLYATDISAPALETARQGIYPLDTMLRGGRNYLASGAKASLSNYYHARYEAAAIDSRLRRSVTFARHNLAMDTSFGEMQLIVCRNVMIYFNRDLRNHVLELFWESLENGGYLCLGDKESISFTSVADRFEVVDEEARIYRKRAPR